MKTILFAAILALFAGCATTDWNKRVGSYTLDQAISELGPPDKQAKLADGRLVAEWVTRYYNTGTSVVTPGYYGYPGGVSVIHNPASYYESRLRLTFTTNSVLAAWSEN